MDTLGIARGRGARFWVGGEITPHTYAGVEASGIIFLAWRCLYAETVRARKENSHLRLKSTYARLVLMTISRLKAQGEKWYRWYSRTKGISQHKVKRFPVRYRNRRLITTQGDASFKINTDLLREYEQVKRDR